MADDESKRFDQTPPDTQQSDGDVEDSPKAFPAEEKAASPLSPAASTDEFGPAPDGGRQAWLVAAGGSCILFACLGFMNSFGVFQQYYMTHQLRDLPADRVAWIGSLTGFIQLFAGAVGGPLFDRFGAKIIRPAAIIYIFALMMTSLCSEYWQFMLCQGVLIGCVMGFLQFPAFAAVSQYWDKKRAAALGLVVSGSSIGGIVFPIALSKMLNGSSLGFGWSVRIMGFVLMPLMLFACVAIRARLPPRKTTFFIWSAFTSAKFVLLIAALFCMFIGLFTPLFFLPSYAVSQGVSPTLASYLLAILNGASTFGRIIPGILADKYGRLNAFTLGGMASGVVIMCLTAAHSTAGLIVYAVAIGFSSGTIISAASAAFTICTPNQQNFGTYMGMGMGVSSVAALIGPPVNGVLLERYGGYLQASLFSGVACLLGGLFALATKSTTEQGLLAEYDAEASVR